MARRTGEIVTLAEQWPDFQIEAAGAVVTEPLSRLGFGYAKTDTLFIRYDWEHVWICRREGFDKYNDVSPIRADVGALTVDDWRRLLDGNGRPTPA